MVEELNRIRQKWKDDFATALDRSLDELVNGLAGKTFQTETGEEVSLSALAIDSGWGEYAPEVYRFCRQSRYKNLIRPSKGMGIGAKRNPLVDPQVKPKSRESVEGQWKLAPTKARVFLLMYDTNYWKSKVNAGLRLPPGTAGSIHLHKLGSGQSHRMIAEQLTAERPDRVEANGRTVDEWSLIPGRDNHFLDCLTGSAVLAHAMGAKFPSRTPNRKPAQRAKEADAVKPTVKPTAQVKRREVVF